MAWPRMKYSGAKQNSSAPTFLVSRASAGAASDNPPTAPSCSMLRLPDALTMALLPLHRHGFLSRRLGRRTARLMRHRAGARGELVVLDPGICRRPAPRPAVLRPGLRLVMHHVGILVHLVAGRGLAIDRGGAA